jgi:hypothetical protein
VLADVVDVLPSYIGETLASKPATVRKKTVGTCRLTHRRRFSRQPGAWPSQNTDGSTPYAAGMKSLVSISWPNQSRKSASAGWAGSLELHGRPQKSYTAEFTEVPMWNGSLLLRFPQPSLNPIERLSRRVFVRQYPCS